MRHRAKAILISPAVGVLFIIFLSGIFLESVSAHKFLSYLFLYTLIGYLVSLFFMVTIGLPASLIAEKFGFTSWWVYFCGGIIAAVPFYTLWFYPFEGGHWDSFKYSNGATFIGSGCSTALTYWYLMYKVPTNKLSQQDASKAGASA